MNIIEAFEKLKQGHKVRRTTWKQGDYIELKSNNIVVDKNGYKCPLEVNMINESWELYNDRKELPDRFKWMKDMYKVYKDSCGDYSCEDCVLDGYFKTSSTDKCLCDVISDISKQLNKEYKLDTQ